MKFSSLALLVATAQAAGPADWTPCVENNCATKTFACCNLLQSAFNVADRTGSMICADTKGNGVIPFGNPNAGGRYLCTTTDVLIYKNNAIQIGTSLLTAASVVYYNM